MRNVSPADDTCLLSAADPFRRFRQARLKLFSPALLTSASPKQSLVRQGVIDAGTALLSRSRWRASSRHAAAF